MRLGLAWDSDCYWQRSTSKLRWHSCYLISGIRSWLFVQRRPLERCWTEWRRRPWASWWCVLSCRRRRRSVLDRRCPARTPRFLTRSWPLIAAGPRPARSAWWPSGWIRSPAPCPSCGRCACTPRGCPAKDPSGTSRSSLSSSGCAAIPAGASL